MVDNSRFLVRRQSSHKQRRRQEMCWEGKQGREKETTMKCMQGKKLQGSTLTQYAAKYIGLMMDLMHDSDINPK